MSDNINPHQQFKATMRLVANLIASSSDLELSDYLESVGENAETLAQEVDAIFESVYRPFERKPSLRGFVDRTVNRDSVFQAIPGSSLSPLSKSFERLWELLVMILCGLGIDRLRLYVLSVDEQCLVPKAHHGMDDAFMSRRRLVRNEPNWKALLSDLRLKIFKRLAGQTAPFEEGTPEGQAVSEWFCLPLRSDGKIVGKLSGDCKTSGRSLSLENLRPIEVFSPLLGSAIASARLLSNIGSVMEVSAFAMSNESPDEVMKEACRAACRVAGADHCTLIEFDEHVRKGRSRSEFPQSEEPCTGLPLKGVPFVTRLIDDCLPLQISDVPNDLSLGDLRHVLAKKEIRSLLAFPISRRGRVIGCLILDTRQTPYKFTSGDIALARICASHVEAAFENERRMAESRKLEQLDRVLQSMLVKTNIDALAELIVAGAREIFEAEFVVLRRWEGRECPDRALFVAGVDADRWISTVEAGFKEPTLFDYVSDKSWVEIANNTVVSQLLGQIQLDSAFHSFQALALKIDKQVEGVLYLAYSRTGSFDSEQRQRIRKFVVFSALCLQRTRTLAGVAGLTDHQNDDRLATHLVAFYEVSQLITMHDNAKRSVLLDRILKHAVECTRIGKDGVRNTFGTIWIFDKTSNTLKFVNSYPKGFLNRPAGYTYCILRDFGGRVGITGRAALQKIPQRIGDVTRDQDYIELDSSTCSELAVPILEGDVVIGVLNLECDMPSAFDQMDEDTVKALAGLASVALQDSRERYLLPATSQAVSESIL